MDEAAARRQKRITNLQAIFICLFYIGVSISVGYVFNTIRKLESEVFYLRWISCKMAKYIEENSNNTMWFSNTSAWEHYCKK